MDCKQEYTKYTAFRDDDGMICFLAVEARSVEDLMCQVRGFYGGWDYPLELLAWAPEWPTDRGGRLECDDLCAESIAAGRLIEKTPSGWVALGAEKQEHFCNRDVPEGFWDFPKPELRKGEPTSADINPAPQITVKRVPRKVDLNAAMIARDGPAKPAATKHFLDCPECGYGPAYCQCKHAKPNPFQNYTAPDCDSGPSDHLNASRHQMAGMKD